MKTIISNSRYNHLYISPRELEVLNLLAHEYTTEMMATELYLSPHTIISHRKRLLEKFAVKNSAGLIRRAFELGVFELHREPQVLEKTTMLVA